MSSPPTLLPLLYATDEINGWSQGMRAITHALLTPNSARYQNILEVGCGAGVFLHEWARFYGQTQLVGTDRNPLAIGHARQQNAAAVTDSTVRFVQSDLHQLPFNDATFDLILALDALDQQGVLLAQALHESYRLLGRGGELLLRVSAYPWLMSVHDVAFNTAHRFRRQQLLTVLAEHHFVPLRITYANSLFALPVIGIRLLQRWSLLPHRTEFYQASLSNQLLAAALHWEARWLRHHNLAGGISLYVLARKVS
ncbi:MAG: class I SAM-dependent methyltransferase [Caldilineaceae bacterium]|nr:class I SAM-dependent methyltransferase [Caldilineaceae bacterium]